MVTPQIPDEVKSLEAAVHRSLPEFGCGRTQSKNRSINLCIQRSLCLSLRMRAKPTLSISLSSFKSSLYAFVFIWQD
ncbi:hypothetical protein E2542_SST19379 [Spatholobus suberectus]|nr:hypothetical protein E2542_SST19379 [Spatholobus suberectus]